MWDGFIKWIYSVATLSPIVLVGLIVAGYVFFLAPFYWLWNDLFVMGAATDWRAILIFQVAMIFLIRWLVDNHFDELLVSTLLHPVGFSFLLLVALYAGSRRAVGTGIHWKKRLYNRESCVE